MCSSRQLRGIFTIILANLAVCDILFLIMSLAEIFRRHYPPESNIYVSVFCYFIYPTHNILLCCTVYIPVALAIERYRAIGYSCGNLVMPMGVFSLFLDFASTDPAQISPNLVFPLYLLPVRFSWKLIKNWQSFISNLTNFQKAYIF